MSLKKVVIIIGVCCLMVLLLLYPHNSQQSARYGLDLWLKNVLPSLLPFVVASFILLETGIVSLVSRFFAPVMRTLFNAPGQSAYVFFASALSGYPVGAKLTGELYERGNITKHEAQQTLLFTSVSGPIFITGAVCTGMLGVPEAGIYLAITHYISALLVGVVFGLFNRKKNREQPFSSNTNIAQFKRDMQKCRPIGDILADSVTKAVPTLLKVGVFIILFCVIIELLSSIGIIGFLAHILSPVLAPVGLQSESVTALLHGSIELASGCAYGSSIDVDLTQKLSVLSFIIAFGGIGVHMQTRAVCKVRPKLFLFAKLTQAIFAYTLSYLSLKVFPITLAASSIQSGTKTAAYFGYVFAAVSIIILVIIKIIQKNSKSTFTLSGKL